MPVGGKYPMTFTNFSGGNGACYLGWQESLVPLWKLVEPEIPG